MAPNIGTVPPHPSAWRRPASAPRLHSEKPPVSLLPWGEPRMSARPWIPF